MSKVERAFIEAFKKRPDRTPVSPPPERQPEPPFDPEGAFDRPAVAVAEPEPFRPEPSPKAMPWLPEPRDEAPAPSLPEPAPRHDERPARRRPALPAVPAPTEPPRAAGRGIRRVERFTVPTDIADLERAARRQFDRLARQVSRAAEESGLKSLLFTSCYRGEGRSSLVVGLGRRLPALTKARTILVDGDFLNPGLARRLGIDVAVGLDDVVLEGRGLEEALVISQADALALLPLRREVDDPAEFVRSDRLAQVLAQLRQTFDLVLIDGTPIFSSVDPTLLHEQLDGAVLAMNQQVTEDASVRRAQHVLGSAGLTVLGMVETFT